MGGGNGKKPPNKSRCIGHYMIGKNIGEGTFGKVKAGTHNVTGEKVSVQIRHMLRIRSKIQPLASVQFEEEIKFRLLWPNMPLV